MDFFDVVNARRSVRDYLPARVPREDLERIIAAGIEAPSGCNAQLRQYVIVDDPSVIEQIRPFSNALKNAPAMIVLLVEPKPTNYGEFWAQDAAAAMQNMLLAAVALGYGSVWVEGAIRRYAKRLGDLLGVPEHVQVRSVLPVGKPAKVPPRPTKSDPAEVVYHNRFGQR